MSTTASLLLGSLYLYASIRLSPSTLTDGDLSLPTPPPALRRHVVLFEHPDRSKIPCNTK